MNESQPKYDFEPHPKDMKGSDLELLLSVLLGVTNSNDKEG